jgi:hypothetical protein
MNAVAKKLLMKSGQRWLLFNAPENYLNILTPLPDGLQVGYIAEGSFDGIQLFVRNSSDLAIHLKHIQPVLTANTVLWIIYPKKSSGIATNLEMMSSWDEPAKYGLRTVAAAAIDQTWTALRFRPEGQSKVSATRNSEIQSNEHAVYIDVVNKTVKLPEDVEAILLTNTLALDNYQKLSYSNQKEYVLWILTAKQEKTRTDRLTKMIEKLLAGKKNPSEK